MPAHPIGLHSNPRQLLALFCCQRNIPVAAFLVLVVGTACLVADRSSRPEADRIDLDLRIAAIDLVAVATDFGCMGQRRSVAA